MEEAKSNDENIKTTQTRKIPQKLPNFSPIHSSDAREYRTFASCVVVKQNSNCDVMSLHLIDSHFRSISLLADAHVCCNAGGTLDGMLLVDCSKDRSVGRRKEGRLAMCH